MLETNARSPRASKRPQRMLTKARVCVGGPEMASEAFMVVSGGWCGQAARCGGKE